MFDEIQAGLSNVFDIFRESVRDEFGMSIVENIFEPMQSELSQLILTMENTNTTLAELDGLRSEIRAMKSI